MLRNLLAPILASRGPSSVREWCPSCHHYAANLSPPPVRFTRRLPIIERFAEPFTVETLADIAGMSRSSFPARFTDTFRQTPMSLLRAVRLRRARELLVTTDTPVAQIAHDVGFLGRSNFSRAFRKMYSVDPTKFRTIAFGRQPE